MKGIGVVALVLSVMSVVLGMHLASKGGDLHPRTGWSYFILAPGKTRFRPVASANLIEAWSVCVKVKSIETAIFVDGMAFAYGQLTRPFTTFTIHMTETDADELLDPLVGAMCNQHTKSSWGNFVGMSFKNLSEEMSGTVRIRFYALALNFFQNSLVIDTINGSLKRDVKVLAKMEQQMGPLINAKHKSRINTRAWAAYAEELDGSGRSGEFYRSEDIHELNRLGRIMSYSAIQERPFRMVIEQTDRSQKAAYRKLEIECTPLDAYEMVSLITIAASNVNKIFGIAPSCGIEHMLGFTLEPHGDKNVLISLHFAMEANIDTEVIKNFVKRLMIGERLNSIIKSSVNESPFAYATHWGMMLAMNGKLLTDIVKDVPLDQFPIVTKKHIVPNADKMGFMMSIAPSNLQSCSKSSMDFAIVMNIPSTNIRLLLIRIWADLMRNKEFQHHRHIEKYTLHTLQDGGPYELIAWLRTTKIRPEELKELRRIYAVFLRYVGIEGVNPMVAIIQNNDKKTMKPYMDDPVDLSFIDFDCIKRAEWIDVQAKEESKSEWTTSALKPASKKKGPVQAKKKINARPARQYVAVEKKVEVEESLEQAIESAVLNSIEPIKSKVKKFEKIFERPVQPTSQGKRSWTDIVAPQILQRPNEAEPTERRQTEVKKVEEVVQKEEEEEDDDFEFSCVLPQTMEGSVHPKDLCKLIQVANTVDARIASLSSGQYSPSALILQTKATPVPSTPQGSLYTASKLLWEGFSKRVLSSESTEQEEEAKVPTIIVTPIEDDEVVIDVHPDDDTAEETSESYDPFDTVEEEDDHSGEHSDDHSLEAMVTAAATQPQSIEQEIDLTQILPLNDQWSMFYIKPPYSIKKLSTDPISTVQVFWQYMNNLPYPAVGHAYAFWRNDGSPETSNVENVRGGRLRTQLKLNTQWTKATGMSHWIHILVWLIANQDDKTISKISGVVLKERVHGHFHIDVWYRKGFQYNDLQVFKRAMAAINEEQKLKFTGEWKIDRFYKADKTA